jgi:WD40 repeat protein/tetratricopeptide (TPR) repeat protein
VAFSPDGKKLITASLDRTARLWDVATGRPIGQPIKLVSHIYSAAFSPDGKWVFIGATDQGQLYDTVTAQAKGPLLSYHGTVYAAAFSPDGKTIVTGITDNDEQKGELRFWQADPLAPLEPPLPQPGPISSVAFSPDGSQVVWAGLDGMAHLLDSASRKPTGAVFRHLGPIMHAGFSPDGQWIITAGSGVLRLWDAESGQQVGDMLPQNSWSRGAAFCPDGRTLVIPRTERTVGIWELPLGRLKGPLFPHPGPITAISFSPDGKRVLIGSGQESRGESRGEGQVWDVTRGEPLGAPWRMNGQVTRVAFTRAGTPIVATPNQISTQSLGQLPIQSDSVAFSADGKTVVTGAGAYGENQSAVLIEIPSGRRLGFPLPLTGQLWALDLDSKGETLVTASGDISRGELQFWNTREFNKIGAPLAYASRVMVVRFSPDGQTVVTGHYDSRALLWNVAHNKRQGPALVHQGPIRAAAFSPDGQFLVTGSVDRTARIWHVKTGQPLGPPLRHPAEISAVAFSPDGALIMTGCADGIARLWQAPKAPADADLTRSVAVVTGLTLSDEGELGHLEGSAWQSLRDRLASSQFQGPDSKLQGPKDLLPWDLQQALQALETSPGANPSRLAVAQWHADHRLHTNPDDWLARVLRAGIAVERNDPDDRGDAGATALAAAAADVESALKSETAKTALPWLRMFAAEAERKQQSTQALWYLDRMVAARPDDWLAHVDRAQLFARLKKWNEAVEAYSKAIDAREKMPSPQPKIGDPHLWLERGRIYAQLKKWDQVAADFVKAISLLPEGQSVNDQRSQICAELAQWDEAMTKAVQLMPGGSDLWIAAGRHLARQSRWDQASAAYARADWTRKLGDDTFEYACLFLIRGDIEGYRKFAEGLINRAGKTKDVFELFVLARIAGMSPPGVLDPARAIQWGKQAVDATRQVPWYIHALGLAYYRAGQFDLALQRFQESQNGNWNYDGLSHFGRALAEYRLGHAGNAQESLAQGLAWLKNFTPAKPDEPTPLFATDWLEAQLLRREAEALIKSGKAASP